MPHRGATQATLPGARGLGALGVRISLRGRLPCSVQAVPFALQAPRRHLRAAPRPPSARVARYGGVSAPQGAGASLVSRRARRGACCGRACAAVGRPRPNPLLAPRRPRARARAAPAAPHTPPSSRLKRRRARGEAARRAATPPARLGLSEAFPRPGNLARRSQPPRSSVSGALAEHGAQLGAVAPSDASCMAWWPVEDAIGPRPKP